MQAYPEFCRSIYDKSPPGMAAAMKELEANGKMATSRYVLLVGREGTVQCAHLLSCPAACSEMWGTHTATRDELRG